MVRTIVAVLDLVVFGAWGYAVGTLGVRYLQCRPMVARAFRVAAQDGHPSTRVLRVGFGCLVAAMRVTGSLAAWLDRRAGPLRIVLEQRIALGPHTPGLTAPRTDAEAIDDLLAPARPGLDKEEHPW